MCECEICKRDCSKKEEGELGREEDERERRAREILSLREKTSFVLVREMWMINAFPLSCDKIDMREMKMWWDTHDRIRERRREEEEEEEEAVRKEFRMLEKFFYVIEFLPPREAAVAE